MTCKLARNHSLSFVAAFIAGLTLLSAANVLAQVVGAGQREPVTSSTVSGVLLGASGAPLPKIRVGVFKVRLVSLLGEEIRTLPPKEAVIIDSDGRPVAVAETDSAGRFEFKEVPNGRYSIAVQGVGGAAEPWLESGGKTIFFDVGRVELGIVNPGREWTHRGSTPH